jgi:hypothetical protein
MLLLLHAFQFTIFFDYYRLDVASGEKARRTLRMKCRDDSAVIEKQATEGHFMSPSCFFYQSHLYYYDFSQSDQMYMNILTFKKKLIKFY